MDLKQIKEYKISYNSFKERLLDNLDNIYAILFINLFLIGTFYFTTKSFFVLIFSLTPIFFFETIIILIFSYRLNKQVDCKICFLEDSFYNFSYQTYQHLYLGHFEKKQISFNDLTNFKVKKNSIIIKYKWFLGLNKKITLKNLSKEQINIINEILTKKKNGEKVFK